MGRRKNKVVYGVLVKRFSAPELLGALPPIHRRIDEVFHGSAVNNLRSAFDPSLEWICMSGSFQGEHQHRRTTAMLREAVALVPFHPVSPLRHQRHRGP